MCETRFEFCRQNAFQVSNSKKRKSVSRAVLLSALPSLSTDVLTSTGCEIRRKSLIPLLCNRISSVKRATWEHREIQTFMLLFPPDSSAVVGTYHGSPDQSHQVAGNHQQPPQQNTGFPRNSQPYYNSRGVSRGGSRGARGLMNGYRGPANGFRGEQLC